MDCWRIDLAQTRHSLEIARSWRPQDGASPRPSRQPASPLPFAVIVDGSRWARPVELLQFGEPSTSRHVLIIDAPALSRDERSDIRGDLGRALLSAVSSAPSARAAILAKALAPEFALAWIDCDRGEVTFARDAFGLRPLYWRRRGREITFASARYGLFSQDESISINESAVAVVLAASQDSWNAPQLLTGVYRVSPGGWTTVSEARETTGHWWRPLEVRKGSDCRGDGAPSRAIRDHLERAIASRTGVMEVVGAHVSGGIDSTGVAAIAARHLARSGRRLTAAYAWSPALSGNAPDLGWRDERRRIEAFAEAESVPVRYGGLTVQGFLGFLDRPIEFEGTADLADEMPILPLAKTDGIQIMMSGWGGDEAFSSHGHGYLAHLIATLQWDRAIRWIRSNLRSLRRVGPLAEFVWWQGLRPLLPNPIYRLFEEQSHDDYSRRFVSPDLLARHKDDVQSADEGFRPVADPIETMASHLTAGHVTHRIETWDVWSRAEGFSYSYPLIDQSLIEALLCLPPDALFPAETPRGLALSVLSDVLPPNVAKFDAANETSRTTVREGAWRALAEMTRSGGFNGDCPWLDMARVRESLANPRDQGQREGVMEFAALFRALRVWNLWRRHSGDEPTARTMRETGPVVAASHRPRPGTPIDG